MLDKNQALLNDAIESGLRNMQDLKPESEEYAKAVDSVTKLYRMKIEEDKADTEFQETEVKKEQAKEARKDRWIRFGLDIAGLILPLASYSFWMGNVMFFEEKGHCSSQLFRSLFNHGVPKK